MLSRLLSFPRASITRNPPTLSPFSFFSSSFSTRPSLSAVAVGSSNPRIPSEGFNAKNSSSSTPTFMPAEDIKANRLETASAKALPPRPAFLPPRPPPAANPIARLDFDFRPTVQSAATALLTTTKPALPTDTYIAPSSPRSHSPPPRDTPRTDSYRPDRDEPNSTRRRQRSRSRSPPPRRRESITTSSSSRYPKSSRRDSYSPEPYYANERDSRRSTRDRDQEHRYVDEYSSRKRKVSPAPSLSRSPSPPRKRVTAAAPSSRLDIHRRSPSPVYLGNHKFSSTFSSINTSAPTPSAPSAPRAFSTTQPTTTFSSAPLQYSAPTPTNNFYNTQPTYENNMPPRHGSSGANRNKRPLPSQASARSAKPLPKLEGNVQSQQEIINQWPIRVNPQWMDNPKAPLANYFGGSLEAGSKQFKYTEGIVAGQKVVRATIVANDQAGIIGVGDGATRKDAEKLAALSATLQLSSRGLMAPNGGRSGGGGGASNGGGKGKGGKSKPLGEHVTLSNGEVIEFDRARQFMDYYCQRFNFGKPDVVYTPAGSQKWEAVMTVGGRKIGMGAAPSKKTAQIRCYLDVTQYLEASDPPLWATFSRLKPATLTSAQAGVPHVVLTMSEDLEDEVRDLCKNIRGSEIWSRSAKAAITTAPAPIVDTVGQVLSQSALDRKSTQLRDQLESYEADNRWAALRDQRRSLPVATKSSELLAKIESNEVTVCMAATGSGKTTQIPQIIFDDYIRRGDGAKCNIFCTQPRRIAAMSVAQRVAAERGQKIGDNVGYQVRFDSKPPVPHGSITFCTTGIFLKRMQSALSGDTQAMSWLDGLTHIVVDEVHERDIDTDLLLVVLKRLVADRRKRQLPVRIVLMSATIDPSLFQNYFIDDRGRRAAVAEVPGRSFPVEKRYLDDIVPRLQQLPVNQGGWVFQDKDTQKYLEKEIRAFNPSDTTELKTPFALVALTISHICQISESGHILVFLDGIEAIRKVHAHLTDRAPLGFDFNTEETSIHVLHSTIPVAEQQQVFEPAPRGQRRIILATNIAETSVTIPDVVYVVDTGRVKEKRYDSARHLSSLVSAWVGTSNLNQRAGRAGRHRNGEYYGILSKQRLGAMDQYSLVEMKRSDLSNVVMHIKALNFGNMEVEEVLAATIEPPPSMSVNNAVLALRQIGALNDKKKLTSLGRVLLQLPVEASLGKLVLYGAFYRCLDSALTLAAILADRDPFLAPMAQMERANEVKDSWSPPGFRSDPLAVVSAYNTWYTLQQSGRYREARDFISFNFIHASTFMSIHKVKEQIYTALVDAGVIAISAGGIQIGRGPGSRFLNSMPASLNSNSDSLPLLAALIATSAAPNFAIRVDEKSYRTNMDKKCQIHQSSVNNKRRENLQAESSAIIAEKALYAFAEKVGFAKDQPVQLRTTTRLDPMTYLLFGAYNVEVTGNGLQCDDWLPIHGNLDALDDLQRLKTLLESCMLRIFEGVGKSLEASRGARSGQRQIPTGPSAAKRIDETDDETENEDGLEAEDTNEDRSLSRVEIIELDNLTADVVSVLDRYSDERGAGVSRAPTAPNTRPATPVDVAPVGMAAGGTGVYRPPIPSQPRHGAGPPTGPSGGAFRAPPTGPRAAMGGQHW